MTIETEAGASRAQCAIHLLQSFSEVLLPTFRQCRNLHSPSYQNHIVVSVSLCDIQASDFGNRDGVWVSGNRFDLITGTDLAFAGDGEIETRPPLARNRFTISSD